MPHPLSIYISQSYCTSDLGLADILGLIIIILDDSDDELLDIAERNEEESNNSHHGQVESERNGLDSSSHRPTDSSTRQRRRPLSRDHDVNKARKLSKRYIF